MSGWTPSSARRVGSARAQRTEREIGLDHLLASISSRSESTPARVVSETPEKSAIVIPSVKQFPKSPPSSIRTSSIYSGSSSVKKSFPSSEDDSAGLLANKGWIITSEKSASERKRKKGFAAALAHVTVDTSECTAPSPFQVPRNLNWLDGVAPPSTKQRPQSAVPFASFSPEPFAMGGGARPRPKTSLGLRKDEGEVGSGLTGRNPFKHFTFDSSGSDIGVDTRPLTAFPQSAVSDAARVLEEDDTQMFRRLSLAQMRKGLKEPDYRRQIHQRLSKSEFEKAKNIAMAIVVDSNAKSLSPTSATDMYAAYANSAFFSSLPTKKNPNDISPGGSRSASPPAASPPYVPGQSGAPKYSISTFNLDVHDTNGKSVANQFRATGRIKSTSRPSSALSSASGGGFRAQGETRAKPLTRHVSAEPVEKRFVAPSVENKMESLIAGSLSRMETAAAIVAAAAARCPHCRCSLLPHRNTIPRTPLGDVKGDKTPSRPSTPTSARSIPIPAVPFAKEGTPIDASSVINKEPESCDCTCHYNTDPIPSEIEIAAASRDAVRAMRTADVVSRYLERSNSGVKSAATLAEPALNDQSRYFNDHGGASEGSDLIIHPQTTQKTRLGHIKTSYEYHAGGGGLGSPVSASRIEAMEHAMGESHDRRDFDSNQDLSLHGEVMRPHDRSEMWSGRRGLVEARDEAVGEDGLAGVAEVEGLGVFEDLAPDDGDEEEMIERYNRAKRHYTPKQSAQIASLQFAHNKKTNGGEGEGQPGMSRPASAPPRLAGDEIIEKIPDKIARPLSSTRFRAVDFIRGKPPFRHQQAPLHAKLIESVNISAEHAPPQPAETEGVSAFALAQASLAEKVLKKPTWVRPLSAAGKKSSATPVSTAEHLVSARKNAIVNNPKMVELPPGRGDLRFDPPKQRPSIALRGAVLSSVRPRNGTQRPSGYRGKVTSDTVEIFRQLAEVTKEIERAESPDHHQSESGGLTTTTSTTVIQQVQAPRVVHTALRPHSLSQKIFIKK